MIETSASTVVEATPQEVLEFVLDFEAYRRVDQKISKVYRNPPVPEDGMGMVEFRASMRGLPGPRQRQRIVLDRWRSLTFRSDGPWLADRMVEMSGSFEAEPVGDGRTTVTHGYNFRFKGPIARVLEWHSRAWLVRDVQAEFERLKNQFARPMKAG